jgi:hypothetical protein
MIKSTLIFYEENITLFDNVLVFLLPPTCFASLQDSEICGYPKSCTCSTSFEKSPTQAIEIRGTWHSGHIKMSMF